MILFYFDILFLSISYKMYLIGILYASDIYITIEINLLV